MRKQGMSRRVRDRMTAALAMLGAATLMTGFVLTGTAGTAQATGGGGGGGGPDPNQVCAPLDSGKINTSGDPTSVTLTAPAGKLITKYCVKAASANHGDGPVYVDVDPAVAQLTVGYPGGKAISNYSYALKSKPPTVVTPEGEPQFLDPCGTKDDKTIVPQDTELVDWKSWQHGDTVTVMAKLQEGLGDGYVLAPGDWKWTYTFTDVPCEPSYVKVYLDVSFVPDCEETNQWLVTNPSDYDVTVWNGFEKLLVPAGGSVTYTTSAEKDWAFIVWGGKHSGFKKGFDKAYAGQDRTDCEPEPLPVVPEITFTDPCGTADDTVDGVEKEGYTFVVDEETGTVTFTPEEGYYLDGPETLTADWTDEPCPIEATPVEPTVVQSEECDVEGSYTIPATAGVLYLLDEEPIEPGTYAGPVAGVLTAEPVGDTILTIEDWSFDLVVEPAEVCEVAPTEASDVCPNMAGPQTAVPAGYSLVDGACIADEVAGVETEVPVVAPAAGAVPTGVNAGFVAPAEDMGSPLGLSLIVGGLMMLVAAGALQTGRLRRGAHEI